MRRPAFPLIVMCSSFSFSFNLLWMIDRRTVSGVIYIIGNHKSYRKIELLDCFHVQLHVQEAQFRSIHLLNICSHLTEKSAF